MFSARHYRRTSPLAVALLVLLAAAPLGAVAAERGLAETGDFIVIYRDGVREPGAVTRGLERSRGFTAQHTFRSLKGFTARLSRAQVEALRADPQVALVDADREVQAAETFPIAGGDAAPPGLRRIEAATGTHARGPSGVNVAVIDTGIDLAHPDLNAVHGTNCMGSGPANDDNGHGTHVAGTIAARNNGSGVVGVAPGTRLVAVKVLNAQGGGTTSSVVCGIDWVTSTLTDADPGNDIAVVNMSLGGGGPEVKPCATTGDAMHRAICSSVAAGVHYVVAAGNSGWDFDYRYTPDTPAAYPQVLTVTAMTDTDGLPGGLGASPTCSTSVSGYLDDRPAGFSNFAATAAGQLHTIAAPGTCISSTWPGNRYQTISGTSMAAPHVAGAVALCLSEGGNAGPCAGLTPDQVVAKMRSDAADRSAADAGYGYAGDPLRPISGRYFGHLVHVGAGLPPGSAERVPPTVLGIGPAVGATGQPTGAKVSVSFDQPMDRPATQAAFALARTGGGAALGGTFTWSGNTMTFSPSAALAQGTTYRATLSTSALNLAGLPLAAPLEWTFRTLITGTRAPSGVAIESGGKRSGGYRKLAADDNVYYEVNSTARSAFTTSWYARFASVPRDLSSLRVDYRGRNTRACTQAVAVWRWSTASWVQLDARSVGKTKTTIDVSAPGALGGFVSGTGATGELRVRVRCSTTAGAFYARADYMRLSFSQP